MCWLTSAPVRFALSRVSIALPFPSSLVRWVQKSLASSRGSSMSAATTAAPLGFSCPPFAPLSPGLGVLPPGFPPS
eukprot:7423802-Alexandrium_andersonii.AAC.1